MEQPQGQTLVQEIDPGSAVDRRNRELEQANEELRREMAERENAENALRESRERHRLLIDNLPVGVFRMGPGVNGRFLLANVALVQMFGCKSIEELLETDLAPWFEDAQEYRRVIDKLSSAGRVTSEEVRLKRRDEAALWGEITANTVRNGAGEVDYVNGLVMDVTERKLLETQLAQSQKLEAMGQLAAGVAHEINTPIQYVGDNTRFLEESVTVLLGLLDAYDRLFDELGLGAEAKGRFQAAREEADLAYLRQEIPTAVQQSLEGVDRVTGIVRAMKEFAHPDTDEKAPTDLNKVIESTVTLARNEWKYVADMKMDLARDLPPVPVLLGDIKQVILNMLVNAAHAIGDVAESLPGGKGLITVSSRVDGDWAEIRIADTGCGIAEEARPKIFDLFFTTKPVGKGTGQGLAISRAVVVEKHGGTITFETQVGKGTTFTIRIPVSAPGPAKEAIR